MTVTAPRVPPSADELAAGRRRMWVVFAVIGVVVLLVIVGNLLPDKSGVSKSDYQRVRSSCEAFAHNQDLTGDAFVDYVNRCMVEAVK